MTSSVAKTCFDAIRAKQSAVTAGYDPMVVENQGVYEQLLLRAVDSSSMEGESERDPKHNRKTRTRRQTPLVNAGYASRVLSISYAIRSFVSYQKLVSSTLQRDKPAQSTINSKRRIRIVLLGCGVDVIGFWAHSLVNADDNISLTIIEIDKPEVCEIKRVMITNQGMVKNLVECSVQESTASNGVARNYYTGNIVPPSSTHKDDNACVDNSDDAGYDYLLMPGDLNDTSSLETIIALDDNHGKKETPTLVVSELVLSYLPPISTDRLLSWCAARLCKTYDSALVSLEPLGSSGISTDLSASARSNSGIGSVVSVEEGYKQDYCKKFLDKMERGRSTNRIQNGTEPIPASPLFHPIGSSSEMISSRLKKAGFSGCSCASSLGVISSVAAASSSKSECDNDDARTLVCPDIFDEHAALILHLQAYVLACGFVAPKNHDDLLFHRLLCPWAYRQNARPDLALTRSGLPMVDFEGRIVYNEIEVGDETFVRRLFQNTYGKEYTDKYTAIRKMVKGVLNSDMRETVVASTTTQSASVGDDSQRPHKGSNVNSSAIGNFYHASGGIFIVATQYSAHPSLGKKTVVECSGRVSIPSQIQRQVVGCVGIRSHRGKDADSSSNFEIFRLAVDANHRGRGIGKKLLRSVEAYVKERRNKQRPVCIKFVANTLTILENAANLYERCGYRVERETPLGNQLVLRTYTKEVGAN